MHGVTVFLFVDVSASVALVPGPLRRLFFHKRMSLIAKVDAIKCALQLPSEMQLVHTPSPPRVS